CSSDLLRTSLGPVKTEGDTNRTAPLTSFGGQGVFISALRDALLEGRIDVAVHSLKDLPTRGEPRITLSATPQREDPRDELISRDGMIPSEFQHVMCVVTGLSSR